MSTQRKYFPTGPESLPVGHLDGFSRVGFLTMGAQPREPSSSPRASEGLPKTLTTPLGNLATISTWLVTHYSPG